nr:MAG TPA: hypothetical protein [Caudoviricetes sp.]
MIDSVLKGTGNSRFLKSAVPAGTSWADALAMLQAGTFPIDFNGINTEGFQQVGTPLNKANLLKDATAAQIGLPPTTTPDGMFQALGNTGDLHVWRKTVVSDDEKPAGYTLSDPISFVSLAKTTYASGLGLRFNIYSASSISVSDNGVISLNNPQKTQCYLTSDETSAAQSAISGKYVTLEPYDSSAVTVSAGVWYFEPTTTVRRDENEYIATNGRKVTAYPLTPAGTTTTYPVSTNPNAYQEGDDAKPAGYTLGEVKTGKHILSYQHSDLNEIHWEYSSRITVSDDGTVSLVSPSSEDIDGGDYTSVAENLIGKFARPTEDHSGFTTNVIVFFPSGATVTRDTTTYGYQAMTISKYQPVTGYAAIPAGTTIEYLGKLGDKARVQVVSYVGTGTYGADNPCSLTFDFAPKVVIFIDYVYTDGANRGNHYVNNYSNIYYEMTRLSTKKLTDVYKQSSGFGAYNSQLYGKKTNGGKTITWYAQSGADYQGNSAGYTYTYLGIG